MLGMACCESETLAATAESTPPPTPPHMVRRNNLPAWSDPAVLEESAAPAVLARNEARLAAAQAAERNALSGRPFAGLRRRLSQRFSSAAAAVVRVGGASSGGGGGGNGVVVMQMQPLQQQQTEEGLHTPLVLSRQQQQ